MGAPWVQRKFYTLCDKFSDGDWIEARDQSKKGIRLLQTGNVGVAEFFNKPNNAKWISDEVFEKLHCEEVFEGDILISRLPDPAGRACLVPNLETRIITAVDCTIARISPEFKNHFIVQYLSTDNYFRRVSACLAGGTRQRISRKNLGDLYIPLPKTCEERNAIGTFLLSIDTLVALRQRKLDLLKEQKKGLLQKMFPRNGLEFPEIRFSGFTESWEQRKFGEIFKEYSIKNHQELPALTIVQGTGTVERDQMDRQLNYHKANLKSYKLVYPGDFIVHLRSFEGGLEKANSKGIVSPAYHIFHGENIDYRFYYPFFRSDYFIKHLLKPCVYGIRDGKSISISELEHLYIPYASIEEQRKIGDFIDTIDYSITLHQRNNLSFFQRFD